MRRLLPSMYAHAGMDVVPTARDVATVATWCGELDRDRLHPRLHARAAMTGDAPLATVEPLP